MARNKRQSAATEIYAQHLVGTKYASNPVSTRVAQITQMYIQNLTELAMNRFKWEGLPEEIDVRFLEYSLFMKALAIFYWDKDFDKYFAMQGVSVAPLNMLNNPAAFTTVGNDYISKTLAAYQSYKKYTEAEKKMLAVPIWSNYLRWPDYNKVFIYAERMAEMDRTIEINSKNARRNKVILGPDNMRLSTVNINRQIDEGQDGIQINTGGPLADMSFVQAVDMGINVGDIEKLHIVRTRMWNEVSGLLGIDNANQDKKERLVSSEVDANNEQTSMMRYVNLNARRQACEDINKVFGLNVSVEYFTDADTVVEAEPEKQAEKVPVNED